MRLFRRIQFLVTSVLLLGLHPALTADVPLIGRSLPGASLLDGDFEEVRAGWRQPKQSPYWKTEIVKGQGKVGCALGNLMNNGASVATAESVVLDHPALQQLTAGDVLAWRFSSSTEYPSDGRVSFSFVFGDQERVLTSRVKVPNGPDMPKNYEGFYT